MFGLNRRNRPATRKGLLSLLTGLWLFAAALPCVMAAPCPSGMDGPCPTSGTPDVPRDNECDAVRAAACQITAEERQLVRLPAADLDVPAPAITAILLPPAPAAASVFPDAHPERFVLRLSPLPLYRQYSVYRV